MTPAAWRAASVARASPASEPVCATAAPLRLLAPTHLDREDRHVRRERSIREGEEPLGPLEALDEEHDRVGRRVIQARREVVAHVEDGLRAAADDPAPADPGACVDERVGDAARLRDRHGSAAPDGRRHVVDVRHARNRQVDDAHAVRAEERDARVASRSRRPRPASAPRPRRPRPRRRPGRSRPGRRRRPRRERPPARGAG